MFFQRKRSDAVTATFKMLTEAKQENYDFKILEAGDDLIIPASLVELSSDCLKYTQDRTDFTIYYKNIVVQVLASSKRINIIRVPNELMIKIVGLIPLIGGYFTYQGRNLLARYFNADPDFFEGFGIAFVIVGYGSVILGAIYFREVLNQRKLRAVNSTAQLITRLEKASNLEDYFSRLIQVNLSNMDHFYNLVRSQTEKSYRLTQAASVLGFILLILGFCIGFYNGFDKAIAGVTVASGAVVQFISAIFFYIYNKTVTQLNSYHERLVNVQDTMLALKVAQIVKDDTIKDETMAYLVVPEKKIKSINMPCSSNTTSCKIARNRL